MDDGDPPRVERIGSEELRLLPRRAGLRLAYAGAAVMLTFCLLLIAVGVRALIHLRPPGLLALLIGVGGSLIVLGDLRARRRKAAAEVVFDKAARRIRFAVLPEPIAAATGQTAGGPGSLAFDCIDAIELVDEGRGEALRLRLESGDRPVQVTVARGLRPAVAEELARHVAGIVDCPAVSAHGAPLEALPAKAPWQPPRVALPPGTWFVAAAATAITTVGAIAFLAGFVLSQVSGLTRFELPLGDAQGIAVDADGRVYIGSRAYRRVQRYSPTGVFERGWHVPVGKGDWRMAIGADGRLRLRVGSHTRYRLATDDALVQLHAEPAEEIHWQAPRSARSADGGHYSLTILPPRVARDHPADGRRTIFRQDLLRTLLMAPFPAYALIVLGALGLVFVNQHRRSARRCPESRRTHH